MAENYLGAPSVIAGFSVIPRTQWACPDLGDLWGICIYLIEILPLDLYKIQIPQDLILGFDHKTIEDICEWYIVQMYIFY